MLEGLGDFIIASASMGSGGLSFLSQGFFPFFPHLIGDQQRIDETQDCCREAQDLSDTTQIRRKGQTTLTTSSAFISGCCSYQTVSRATACPSWLLSARFVFPRKGKQCGLLPTMA